MAQIFAWFYGPDGDARIFHDDAEIPKGWRDRPFPGKRRRKANLPRLSGRRRAALVAIAAAEGAVHAPGARVMDITAAILAKRAGGIAVTVY
jgi:hypothetical protein